ncbi:hypothetical protein [Paenibacillus sp.]|uniref:hypothetical protein n=1 Tax=Paenibacillus sp. TaxID=58172 RepID=UPI002D38CE0A|nr:hypothetical protein [Paenibacillus sp.]HZG84570.1 hypothetical protein [Paenibacillus sp.]
MAAYSCKILETERLSAELYLVHALLWEGTLPSAAGLVRGWTVRGERIEAPVGFADLGGAYRNRIKFFVDAGRCADSAKAALRAASSGGIEFAGAPLAIRTEGSKLFAVADASGTAAALPALLAAARFGIPAELAWVGAMNKPVFRAWKSYADRLNVPVHAFQDNTALAKLLAGRPSGARLLAACEWRELEAVRRRAREAGFAEEEMQCVVFGPPSPARPAPESDAERRGRLPIEADQRTRRTISAWLPRAKSAQN